MVRRTTVCIGFAAATAAFLSVPVSGQYPLPTEVDGAGPLQPPIAGEPTAISAGDIAGGRDDLLGSQIRVTSEVREVVGPQVFLLDDGPVLVRPDVIVITPMLRRAVAVGESVTVTGTVRRYDAEGLRPELGWNWWKRWHPGLATEVLDRPAVVAHSVRTLADVELVGTGTAE